MTPPQGSNPPVSRPEGGRWRRADTARFTADFAAAGRSQRDFAHDHALPRSTLGHWLRRHDHLPEAVDPDLAAFFLSQTGEAFLRRLVLALFSTFHFRAGAGLRSLGLFLQLTGLDAFVASSYGALHSLGAHLEADLVSFAQEERARLAAQMPPRTVVACLDENFHRDQPYLVAIEPTSGFLLLEQHCPTRDADAWQAALQEATAGLRVEVVLVCSDRAGGLIKCAKEMGVPHSPDLFHAQRDIGKPLLRPLAQQISNARKELEELKAAQQGWQEEKEQAQAGPTRPGRRLDYDRRIDHLGERVEQAERELAAKEGRLEQAKGAIRQLADLAHPFDPKDGRRLEVDQINERMETPRGELELAAEGAGLSEAGWPAVVRSHEWVAAVLALATWYGGVVTARVQGLGLSEEAERSVYEELLPGLYWQGQVSKARDATQRQQRRELSEGLLERAWGEGGALARLDAEEREEVRRQAEELAGLFVRSSSCVEGRNGRLALWQHGQAHLSTRRLQAQTALANYSPSRADGQSPAERFFAVKQRPLFDSLLQRMPDLPRPASKRPQDG